VSVKSMDGGGGRLGQREREKRGRLTR